MSHKIQKVESLLLEIIPEALAQLSDAKIRDVAVVKVECTRGKYDANVYLISEFSDETEKKEILKHLRKAEPLVRSFCLRSTGWFRCPKFHFVFDASLQKLDKLDFLFKQIEESRKNAE